MFFSLPGLSAFCRAVLPEGPSKQGGFRVFFSVLGLGTFCRAMLWYGTSHKVGFCVSGCFFVYLARVCLACCWRNWKFLPCRRWTIDWWVRFMLLCLKSKIWLFTFFRDNSTNVKVIDLFKNNEWFVAPSVGMLYFILFIFKNLCISSCFSI